MIGNMVQDECEGALERSSPRLSLVLQQSMVGAAALPPGRDREGSKGEGGGRKKKRRSQTDLFYPLCFSPLRPYCSLRTGGENGIAEAPLLLQPYLLEGFRRDPASTDGGGGGGGRQTAVLLLRPTESERPRVKRGRGCIRPLSLSAGLEWLAAAAGRETAGFGEGGIVEKRPRQKAWKRGPREAASPFSNASCRKFLSSNGGGGGPLFPPHFKALLLPPFLPVEANKASLPSPSTTLLLPLLVPPPPFATLSPRREKLSARTVASGLGSRVCSIVKGGGRRTKKAAIRQRRRRRRRRRTAVARLAPPRRRRLVGRQYVNGTQDPLSLFYSPFFFSPPPPLPPFSSFSCRQA